MSQKAKIYLRLDPIDTEKFEAIKEFIGLKNDTEVLRYLINWFYKEHQEEIEKPRIKHFNIDEKGVTLVDERIKTPNSPFGRIFQVFFDDGNAICELCHSRTCEHVKYALSLPQTIEIFKKKGWKLPEV